MKKDLPLTALVRSFVTMAFLTSSSLGVMADNPRKSATNLQFYTYVSASESRDAGFYTFNSSNPTVFTPVGNDVKCYGGATYAQGKFWSSYYEENEDNSKITFPIHLYGYNTADWTIGEERQGFAFTDISSDLAFDPETQAIYGIFSDADYSGMYLTLGRLTYSTKDDYPFVIYSCQPIAQMPERMVALTFNRDGQLYTISKTGKLYTVDKYTGKATVVGNTGFSILPFFQSATCDYATGDIYWAAYSDVDWATHVLKVNPATANVTEIVNYGFNEDTWQGEQTYDQLSTIFLKQDLDLATLPKPVSSMSVTMTSLAGGSVTFTMPTLDVEDKSLPADLAYTVRINGETVAHANAAPGATVTAPFTAAKSGNSVFSVTAEIPATTARPAAVSEQTTDTKWVGYDVPMPPTAVKVKAKGNDVTLTWKAPEASVNGGYFDKDNLRYAISRFKMGETADSVIVTTDCAATTYIDHVESTDMTWYYYKVTALNGDLKSQPATSVEVSVGSSLSLPYHNGLSTSASMEDFTIVDANDDGSTWSFDGNYNMVAYTANSSNAADDWFITPPINMQKGAAYKFSFDAVNDYPTERVAAAVGTDATAEAMTDIVIEPTEVTYQPRRRTLSGTFRATEDGMRYFGIHAISDADCNHLYVDNLNITEVSASAPDSPTDLVVTPGEKGATTAALSFTAPTRMLGGAALTDKMDIVISRNGESLTTLTSVTPGQKCSYNDPSVPSGSCVYAVHAVDASGNEGLETTAKVFVGIDEPGAVKNLRAYEDAETEGLIHVVWDQPEGVHGGYIDPNDLTYYISVGTDPNDINLGSKTSYDDQLTIKAGRQAYNGYSVYAVSSTGGSRSNWKTCMAIGGPAIKAPMIESFKNVTMKSGPWITNVTKGEVGEAYCYAMTSSASAQAQDGDGGMQSFSADKTGKAVRSESPKVDISEMAKPTLNFWAYCTGKGDKLTVSVQKDYADFVPVKEIITDQYAVGWQRFSIDLTPYKDCRYVRIGFEGEAVNTTTEFFAYDNVAIVDAADNDIMAVDLTAAEEVEAGDMADLQLTVRNNTANEVAAGDYTIVVYKNGEEFSRFTGDPLSADRAKTIGLNGKVTVVDDDKVDFSAVVDYAADQIEDNNASNTVSIRVKKNDYPTPSGLEASSRQSSVGLSWQAPDLNSLGLKRTSETFDNYKAFAISDFGDWTTYDCDLQNTIQITLSESFGPLQYENSGEPMAFQVFNSLQAGIPFTSWEAHSGEQMLVSFSCASPDGGFTKKQNDDWLVSPELCGEAQTVRFFAKAGIASAVPEQMEVLYSVSDKTIDSFKKIGETIDVSNVKGWDEYKVELPQGAKYFAIRCVSNNKFALLIDDISYIAKGAEKENLTFVGYNVYRDRQKLNAKPIDQRYYIDDDVRQSDSYAYQVTAAYEEGESKPSNTATITYLSAINDASAAAVVVSGGKGSVEISCAEGRMVKMFTVDGRLIRILAGGVHITVEAEPGVYVVMVDGSAFKVSVRK